MLAIERIVFFLSLLSLVFLENHDRFAVPSTSIKDAVPLNSKSIWEADDGKRDEKSKFAAESLIDGKKFFINGIRISETMCLAVICDESKTEIIPTSDIVKIAAIYSVEFVQKAHSHRNRSLGFPVEHLGLNKDDSMWIELMDAVKRSKAK